MITYDFSEKEIRSLAKFLRSHEASLDADLDRLHCFLEDSVYKMLTIEEAEEFYGTKGVR